MKHHPFQQDFYRIQEFLQIGTLNSYNLILNQRKKEMKIHTLCRKFTEGTCGVAFPPTVLSHPEWLPQGRAVRLAVLPPTRCDPGVHHRHSQARSRPQALKSGMCHGEGGVQMGREPRMHLGAAQIRTQLSCLGQRSRYSIVCRGNSWPCLHISKSRWCGQDLAAECQIKPQNKQTNVNYVCPDFGVFQLIKLFIIFVIYNLKTRILLFITRFFSCVWGMYACIPLASLVPVEAKRGYRIPGVGITDS